MASHAAQLRRVMKAAEKEIAAVPRSWRNDLVVREIERLKAEAASARETSTESEAQASKRK